MSNYATHQSITSDISFGPFPLTSIETLENVTLRYELVGPSDAPIILVNHALTGNHLTVGSAENPGWWSGLIGSEKYIDTEKYQVITFNVLGGCDGSTGPTSLNPKTGSSYRVTFPSITVRDMVHAQYLALQKLGITKLKAIIGGSLGGMQVLEWGLLYPTSMEKLIVLAATPTFSDYGIAFNHIASSAIKNDPDWKSGLYDEKDLPLIGLELARMVGMVTYRSSDLFSERFNRSKTNNDFEVMSYLNYQGEKLSKRFDPNSYLYLLEAMNAHDIGAGRGGWDKAAQDFLCPILAVSYAKDIIYEPDMINAFANAAPNTTHHHIQTNFGHDGFLTEFEKWGNIIARFLA